MKKNVAIHFGTVQEIVYTNYRGDQQLRRVVPQYLWFGEAHWYADSEGRLVPQWFLDVFDLDKRDNRTLALAGVKVEQSTPPAVVEEG